MQHQIFDNWRSCYKLPRQNTVTNTNTLRRAEKVRLF